MDAGEKVRKVDAVLLYIGYLLLRLSLYGVYAGKEKKMEQRTTVLTSNSILE